jgi:hypothetical protein
MLEILRSNHEIVQLLRKNGPTTINVIRREPKPGSFLLLVKPGKQTGMATFNW